MSNMNAHLGDCTGYCCSDFRTHDESLGTAPFQTSLTNDIHELFDERMFPGLTTKEYSQLELPLKLASRMLTDQRVVEYIVTCTDGSLHNDHPRDAVPGPKLNIAETMAAEKSSSGVNPPLLRYPRTLPDQTYTTPRVTDTMRVRSQEILKSLKRTLRQISVRDVDEAGSTRMLRSQPLSPRTLAKFPNSGGCKLIVTLSREKVFEFSDHDENSAKYLASHYLMARILVHEISHVLNRAVSGWRPEEVFYQNECCNESGFALEQALFGGFAQFRDMEMFTEHGRKEEAVISEAWPTKGMVEHYNAPGSINQSFQRRWGVDEWSTATRIPWSFIADMFTDIFWEQTVLLMGDGPIEPCPKLSWLTKVVQPGDIFVNSVGNYVMAGDIAVVTCSPNDILPEHVRHALDAIVNDQNARRRLM